MMKPINIQGRHIGVTEQPFIIAEMSGNHNQSLEKALKIVDAAADSGAHAIKLQTYTADTMTLNLREREFVIPAADKLWGGRSLYDLYEEAHTPWDWHKPIFDRCRERGIICFSTPFDRTSVEFLEKLDAPCYKIASFENVDIPLIELAAATGKPMIMSTGMATLEELDEAVAAARRGGCKDLVLLKCTSTYPASPENTNILTIPDLRRRYECEVGLSDHTMGFGVSVASVALGASVIEKHFTLSRAEGGVDSAFSMEPEELRTLVAETEKAWKALGGVSYGPTAAEVGSRDYRRSLYVCEDVRAGESFTEKNVRAIRPGLGLPPKHFHEVLGRKAATDIQRGTALTWQLVKKDD